MKTAISVEDDLLLQADRTARKMGISRSRLFSIALEAYLRNRSWASLSASEPSPEERRTVAGMKTRFRSTIHNIWRA